jgi:phosphatidylglycerophosphatase A
MNLSKRRLFLTFFGSGLSPKAPGTVGTFFALPVGLAVQHYVGAATLLLLTIAVSFAAIKEIDKEEAMGGEHDDKSIVIDEAVGIWLTLAMTYAMGNMWLQAVLAFAFFRAFDILKPSVIGKIDKNVKGGLGVVGDDLLAGLFAGLASMLTHKAILLLL